MASSVRRALFTLHQWVGLAAGLFLIVISVSGSALVFENDIDRVMNPASSYVTPGTQLLPIETMIAQLKTAYPSEQITGVSIGERPNYAYAFSLRSRLTAMVNPYTGEVLGVRDREKSFSRWLHLLHTRLVADKIGEAMVGWFSVAMLGLALTGLVLWWPRKIFRSAPLRRGSGRTSTCTTCSAFIPRSSCCSSR